MRVLGIDPGSETLGWGIVEGNAAKYASVDFGSQSDWRTFTTALRK
jgi:Holliday junction resolvasome RuvABC endonuclease subunit